MVIFETLFTGDNMKILLSLGFVAIILIGIIDFSYQVEMIGED